MIKDEIGSILSDRGAARFGRDLYWGEAPATGDTAIVTIYEYAAGPPLYTKDGVEWEYVRLQVVARALDPSAAVNKAEAVHDALRHISGREASGGYYDWVRALQRPAPVSSPGEDDRRTNIHGRYEAKRRVAL